MIWHWLSFFMNGMWLASQLNCSGVSFTSLEFQTCATVYNWLTSHIYLCCAKINILYCTRFQTQVRILFLHLSFMNHFSHHVLTNYSIYMFLCQQIIFWISVSSFLMPFIRFWMLHYLLQFLKLLTYPVGFEPTTSDLLPVDSNTLPLCHGRLRTCIDICIFIFKFALIFLNSEYHCL